MKVLFINSVCKTGSTGKIVYDLYTQIRENGDDAAICYGRGGLVDGENIYRFAPKLEVYFHALMTRITGWTGCFSPIGTKNLIKFIQKYKPDVIHIHELHAYFVNLKPLMNYIKEREIKTVWTFHCEFMYTGKCGHSVECEKWQTVCGGCPHLKDYPKTIFFDVTRSMFLQKKALFDDFNQLILVTPSEWLANRVKVSFLKKEDIRVVRNGIDTEYTFFPRKYDCLKKKHNIFDEKIVLAVAPDLMSRQKGGRYVLQLADRMKSENFKFLLIGVSDLSEKFPSNVIALGRTENKTELAEYYSMADIFVICSERENLPTTCLEALCCGTPVCGFDVGGIKETAPNDMGIFVQYGDVDALRFSILTMMEKNKDGLSQLAKKLYSKKKMYENYYYLYR